MITQQFIDGYSRKTRLIPAALVLVPALLMALIYGIDGSAAAPLLYSTSGIFVITMLLTQIGRHSGKKKEPALWAHWGGPPSTQLLRWRNNTHSTHIKQRYHTRLQLLFPVAHPPDAAFEAQYPAQADEVYDLWCHFLRMQAREDTKKFRLVFIENVNYGLCRNLWGLKPIAIFSIIFLGAINYGFNRYWNVVADPFFYGEHFWITTGMLATVLIGWIFFVNKNRVKIPAFAYAERLIESINILPVPNNAGVA
ncbi:hypothetical protein [Chitinophaga tropicalis]|uniref:Uncharacterized protein n=1 Tax=Chitinophaga tropicalis TaxID=2683588 RepID=A0A7K1U6R1_9BACT|nr:hypothetical protein [Chitinophaga tropicalis]MVT10053.1 hypothetical protein [Chitinophaga tropicalis]